MLSPLATYRETIAVQVAVHVCVCPSNVYAPKYPSPLNDRTGTEVDPACTSAWGSLGGEGARGVPTNKCFIFNGLQTALNLLVTDYRQDCPRRRDGRLYGRRDDSARPGLTTLAFHPIQPLQQVFEPCFVLSSFLFVVVATSAVVLPSLGSCALVAWSPVPANLGWRSRQGR